MTGRGDADPWRAAWPPWRRTRGSATATLVLICLGLGLAGCFREASAEHTYAEGLTMVDDSVTAFRASMNPQPVFPSPRDEGDAGSCNGLDGDSDGQMKIIKVYALGAVPVRTSDAWFEQAQRFFAEGGYRVTGSVGSPGETTPYRLLGARHEDTKTSLVLRRSNRDGTVELTAQSPCVLEPLTPARTN